LLVAAAALVIIVLLLPAGIRLWRRRGRLRAAARGPDPLWRELADTATDLGYVWSPVRSPRQIVTWLPARGRVRRGQPIPAKSGRRGRAVPLRGAARRRVATRELVTDLRRVETSLRATRSRWERARARLLPESLGWLRRANRRH